MTPAPAYAGPAAAPSWFTRTTDWLDARGKGAWIATMVLGFIFFWPMGLAILAYMIWSNRMFSRNKSSLSRTARRMTPTHLRSSGNQAFDSYKQDMLRRLEDEQEAFEGFLQRLRDAKDKAEFDQFMEDREKTAKADDDKSAA